MTQTSPDFGALPPGAETTKTPIGVPADYKPTFHHVTEARSLEHAPQDFKIDYTSIGTQAGPDIYTSGDEWAPLNSSPDQIWELQQQLVNAGYLSRAAVRPGQWDNKSASAYRTVLAFANATGASKDDALAHLATNPPLGSATQGPSMATHTTNPIATREAYRSTSEQMRGVPATAAEAEQFAQYYKGQEDAANAASNKNELAGAGNSVAPPDAGSAAAAYLREKDPSGVHGFGMLSRLNDFEKMLSSAVG